MVAEAGVGELTVSSTTGAAVGVAGGIPTSSAVQVFLRQKELYQVLLLIHHMI